MKTSKSQRAPAGEQVKILQDYDIAADAKNRISLRGAKSKYFHVKALSNGCYVLEPRELVRPKTVSARSAKMLEQSVAGLNPGVAAAKPGRPPSVHDLGLDLIGSIKGLPADIATNPKYMEGFGE